MDAFDDMIAQLNEVLQASEPLSPRAHVVATMIRFAEAGRQVMSTRDDGPPVRRIAVILAVRDIARQEQDWVRGFLREETPSQEVLDSLHFYHARLAQIESISMMAIAYIGTDREQSEDASWLASTSGALTGDFISDLAEHIAVLPSPRASS